MQHRQTPYLKFLCNSHLQDELKIITQCTRIACSSIQDVEIPLIQSPALKKRMEQRGQQLSITIPYFSHLHHTTQHPSTCTKALDNIKSRGASIPISPSPHLHYATGPRTDHATVSQLSKRPNLVIFTLWTPTRKSVRPMRLVP